MVIGQREDDLSAVALDFAEQPLLMVLGDNKSGKTTLLRHLIRTIRENSMADRVAFTVLDRRLHLVEEPLFPDNEFTANIDRVIPAMLGLSAIIEGRRPPTGLSTTELSGWSYSGHTHYLLIDDVDQIPDSPALTGPYVGQRPWTPLIGLLSQAADLGLRVIVTGRATGSGHALMTNPLLRRMNDLQAATLMLSGNPQDGGKIRGHRFARLPAGRAVLLDDSDSATHLQLVHPRVAQHGDSRVREQEEGSTRHDTSRRTRRTGVHQRCRRGADRAARDRARRCGTTDHRGHPAGRRRGVTVDRRGFQCPGQ